MGFSLFEIGNHSGRPVFLYELVWGLTSWLYTSADRDIEFPAGSGKVYKAVAISDEGITQGGSATEFTVKLPANLPIVDLFRGTPPASPIWLRATRFHLDDPDGQSVTYFIGTVGNVKRANRAQAELIGLPISGTVRRTGLRLCWERNCPHMLYDQDCKADMSAFKAVTTLTDKTGTTITVADIGAWAAPQFVGGFVEWAATAEGTLDRRGIESHAGGLVFNVFGTTDRMVVGQPITLYLGCDLTAETCEGTFNNLPNHGGFSFMPGKSPFDGDQVF